MKKISWSTAALVLILLAGVGLLVYPSFSDYWNSLHQTQAIAKYEEKVEQTDFAKLDEMWLAAENYNRTLGEAADRWNPTEEAHHTYEELLNLSGNGIIGALKIPKLKVSLPVYHGYGEDILQVAIGHIEGSSLPTGGEGTHAVLSGHSGLPSAKLLTDLDQMAEGDRFEIHVLNRVLYYEVDQIRIVEPEELNDLKLEDGKDYCTLVTCTPYGVNTHRLLVRGQRVSGEEQEAPVTLDEQKTEPLGAAGWIAALLIFILFIALLIWMAGRRTKKR